MSAGWAPKRFWKIAHVEREGDGFGVRLDTRPVRTPGKSPLVLPTEELAEMVRAEWDAQGETVNPASMPATRMANSAIEKVAPQKAAVLDHLIEYAGSDLLCYRAEGPEALLERQAAAWDPWLAWAEERHGVALVVTRGIMAVEQPAEGLARLRNAAAGFGPFSLAAFYDLVTLPGSYILGLAAVDAAAPPARLWEVSRTDDLWQIEQWGRDDEAEEANEFKRASFEHAELFFRRAGGN